MKYDDGRFAKHPRFCFFALNTEMRWRANERGQVYIKQHSAINQGTPTESATKSSSGKDAHLGDFKEMEGTDLQKIQEEVSSFKYLIIDETSMVGRKSFGMIDRR
uniref:Uncharacterized protein n=1 Tax=Amphimedon queenslandica TaxID=400682 RepID=A0A1X7TEF7_AMPQE